MKAICKPPQALLLILLLQLPTAFAIDANTEQEIDILIDYIGNSSCEFERNGSTVTPAKARAHIELKYGNTRSFIDSTDDFIDYAATKSSLSGRAYKVRCDGVEQPTAQWLREALKRIRNGEMPGPNNQW